MTMLAELIDAVVGGDTHRETHTLELVTPNGVPLATRQIRNDDSGYSDALSWIARTRRVPASPRPWRAPAAMAWALPEPSNRRVCW